MIQKQKWERDEGVNPPYSETAEIVCSSVGIRVQRSISLWSSLKVNPLMGRDSRAPEKGGAK